MPSKISDSMLQTVQELDASGYYDQPDFEDAVNMQQGEQARNTLKHSLDGNPDRMAQVHEIASARGASPRIVEKNLEEIQKQ